VKKKAEPMSPEDEATCNMLVEMEGGGDRAKCPACEDFGLHPFSRPSETHLECRSCGTEFRRPE